MQKMKIILASASPRRRELLAQTGYTFEVQVSEKEEFYTSTNPDDIVKELALLKATDIGEKSERRNVVIIGADTVVAYDGMILGKPKSEEEAFSMIKSFQGDKHQVYTGVAIMSYDENGKEEIVNDAVRTDVYVNPMTDDEIWGYIKSDNVMDKAGSYGIQSGFAVHIEKIEGDYFNVVGLPVSYVYNVLKNIEGIR